MSIVSVCLYKYFCTCAVLCAKVCSIIILLQMNAAVHQQNIMFRKDKATYFG